VATAAKIVPTDNFARRLVLCREREMLGGVWYTTASNAEFPLHIEDELELNFIVNGSATIFANDQLYKASRGDIVWLRPGYVHGIVQRSPDLAFWVVSARSRLVEAARVIDSCIGSGHAAESTRVSGEAFVKLSKQCFALLRAQATPESFNRMLLEFVLNASAAPFEKGPPPVDLHPAVDRARELLSGLRDASFELGVLAKRAGHSAYDLSRLFHRQLGVTLVHYANHERVQLFARLLAERPCVSMLENALNAGFGSYSQFYRCFRAVTNLTPDRFRTLCEDGTLPAPSWEVTAPR
jgi:AraC-like DNA-binding protein